MSIPAWVWIATMGGLLLLLAIDLVIVDRKPHEVTVEWLQSLTYQVQGVNKAMARLVFDHFQRGE